MVSAEFVFALSTTVLDATSFVVHDDEHTMLGYSHQFAIGVKRPGGLGLPVDIFSRVLELVWNYEGTREA